jgi:hypothetical protein
MQVWRQGEQIVRPFYSSVLELKGGVCYGTCVEWLKRLYTHPQENVADRLQHLNDQGKIIGGRQRVYQSARDDMAAKLGDNFTGGAHFQLMSRVLSAGSFDMSFNIIGAGTFLELADDIKDLIDEPTEYLFINVSLANGGHAIAMKVGATSRLLDPNFGEFEIGQNDLDGFFNDYLIATTLAGGAYAMVNIAEVRFG